MSWRHAKTGLPHRAILVPQRRLRWARGTGQHGRSTSTLSLERLQTSALYPYPLPAHTLDPGPMADSGSWATLPRRGGAAGGFDIYIKCDLRDPLSTT